MYKLFILSFFIITATVFANSNKIKFEKFTIQSGLSSQSITCLLQDKNGFLWIGTKNGLNRYDGYNYKVYQHQYNDSTSLSDNSINCIFEDNENQLWVGTYNGGINLFNPKTEKFTHYKKSDDSLSIPSNRIWKIENLDPHNLIVVCDENVIQFNKKTKESRKLFINNEDIQKCGPKTILIDNKKIWLGSWTNGVFSINNETKEISHFNTKNGIADISITSIIKDNKGNIYIGTFNNGLSIFSSITNSFTTINKSSGLSSDKITSLIIDHDILWVGTMDGLNLIDLNNDFEIKEILYNDENNIHSISSSRINCFYLDKAGNQWVGTESGLNKYTSYKEKFNYFTSSKKNSNSLSNSIITSITQDKNDNIWLSTWGGGINKFSINNHEFTFFNKENSIVPDNFVVKLKTDKSGNIYSGYKSPGIVVFDRSLNNMSFINTAAAYVTDFEFYESKIYYAALNNLYVYDIFSKKSILNESTINNNFGEIRFIFRDRNNDLYIGHRFNGLMKVTNDTMYHFSRETNPLIPSNQFKLYKNTRTSIWFTYFDDFTTQFIKNSDEIKTYNFRSNDIFESASGEIWIASNQGLKKYDPIEDKYISYTIDDGLPSNDIYKIEEDSKGRLWIGTSKGMTFFNPETEEIKAFDNNDGLIDYSFEKSLSIKTKSGHMIFCSENGFILFHPDSISYNTNIPNIAITGIKVLNKSVNIGEKLHGQVVLEQSISETEEIKLHYKSYALTIEFAALDFVAPSKNRFSYMLKGLDKEWITTNDHSVTYTNLEPGEYVFMVRGCNNDGVWNNEVKTLRIFIIPPFYKTWWFRIFALLLIGAIVLIWYLYKVASVKRQNKRLNETIKQRTLEIFLQKEELDRLNSSKDKLFSIIGHDLKTPYNTINNLVKMLIQNFTSYDDPKKIEILNLVSFSVAHAQELLDNLLNWSKMNSEKIKYNPTIINLNEVSHHVIDLFRANAANKNIELYSEFKEVEAYADKDMIETIVRNLVSNAIKFTPKNGEVKIGFSENDSMAELYVMDTGVGMDAEKLSKIFDIEAKIATKGTDGEAGTGLGLSLAKEFAERNGGSIHITSEINKGSCFTISIPKNKN